MNAFEQQGNRKRSPAKHQRRPRYSGTHPKHFNEKYKEHNLAAHPEIKEHLRAKGKTPAGTHVPVLVEEVMACLNPKPGEIVADCTVGYGGLSRDAAEKQALEEIQTRIENLENNINMVYIPLDIEADYNIMKV